eukprot:SAG31_NODE_10_length_40133_cov_27.863041_24_plen_142_part_00
MSMWQVLARSLSRDHTVESPPSLRLPSAAKRKVAKNRRLGKDFEQSVAKGDIKPGDEPGEQKIETTQGTAESSLGTKLGAPTEIPTTGPKGQPVSPPRRRHGSPLPPKPMEEKTTSVDRELKNNRSYQHEGAENPEALRSP